MCSNTNNADRAAENGIVKRPCGGRYVIGRAVGTRTYVADRKKGVLLFDTQSEDFGEYSPARVAVTVLVCIAGAVYVLSSLAKGIRRKRTVKLQAKEIKRLGKLCRKGTGQISVCTRDGDS